jgi:hypothetical protein
MRGTYSCRHRDGEEQRNDAKSENHGLQEWIEERVVWGLIHSISLTLSLYIPSTHRSPSHSPSDALEAETHLILHFPNAKLP